LTTHREDKREPGLPPQVTLLITDMEGSTAFTQDQGDAAAMELLRTHESIVREGLAAHGGREIKSMGDGFMIAFDDATTGIECALDIVARLRKRNENEPSSPINVRMGMNTGTVIEEGGDVYGTTVNATSRIVAKARRGQILVSEATREAAERIDCRFLDRGLFWLKGLKERWRLYEATRDLDAERGLTSLEGQTPFVDRENERAALRLLADAANEGRGSFALLGGEHGIGKTRIAEEVAAECADRGMRRLAVRCFEAGLGNAFGPFVDLLSSVERESTPPQFRALLGEAAPEVARLLPHIRRRFPDIPPPAELPPDQERRYLFASIRDVLAAMARQRPVVLHIDDLHWADEQSLLFLEQLALELDDLPMLVIGTYTAPELSSSHPFEVALDAMQRQRCIERFGIDAFGPREVGALLRALSGREPPEELVRLLHAETEGNPFFLEEIVRHLDDRNLLFDASGGWLESYEGVALELPETVRLTIGRRLDTIAPRARSVLTTAAFIGRDFGIDLIAELAETDEDELLDALDDAERSHLISSTNEAGLITFRFTNDLIRQTLIRDVSLSRSQLIQLRVADGMERVYADDLAEHAADIAHHLAAAGRRAERARTVRFYLMAGDRALEKAAYHDAARHFDRALGVGAAEDLIVRAPILEKLAKAERSLGHPDEAIATWNEALEAYEALGESDTVARLCLDAGIQVAWWLRNGDAHRLIARGRAALAGQTTAHLAGLIALEGVVLSHEGHYARAEACLDEALTIARRFDDERVLGRVLYSKVAHHFNFAQHDKAAELGLEAAAHLEHTRELWDLTNVVGFAGQSLGFLGRFEDAATLTEGRRELAERLGNWVAYIYIDRARAWRHIGADPDPKRLEADGKRDHDLGMRLGYNWMRAVGYTRMSYAAFLQGDWDEALERARAAASFDAGPLQGHLGRLVLLHGYRGERDEALHHYEELSRWDMPSSDSPNRFGVWDAFLAALEGLAMLGEDDEVAKLYPIARQAVQPARLFRGWDYRVQTTLAGIAATAAERWDEAEDFFRRSIELVESLPLRLEQPEAYRFYARMLLKRDDTGDRANADTYIAKAIEGYASRGMHRHVTLTQAMATQIA
jgi:class 3 adenylate cyclase/tetratricopeptide (TPR) repeat protein